MTCPDTATLSDYARRADAALAREPSAFWIGRESIEVRLWGRVEVTDRGCWEFTGPRSPRNHNGIGGYGAINFRGRGTATHRAAFMLAFGVTLPPCGAKVRKGDLLVCHTCDNPPCVNPDHLFIGTHKDNRDDMIEKGRGVFPSGEDSAVFRPISDAQREEILALRASRVAIREIGAAVGFDAKRIMEITNGERPKHARGMGPFSLANQRGMGVVLSDGVKAQIRAMRADGITQQEIADAFGLSRGTVVRYTQGIQRRKCHIETAATKAAREARIAEARVLRAAGWPLQAIAERFAVSRGTAGDWVRGVLPPKCHGTGLGNIPANEQQSEAA